MKVIEILKRVGSEVIPDQIDPSLIRTFRAYPYNDGRDMDTCVYLWNTGEKIKFGTIVIAEHPDVFAQRLALAGVLVRVENIKSYGG